MLRHVKMTLEWLPPSVRAELDAVKGGLPALKYIRYPDLILRDILEQANVLEKSLMDSFTILMSSISVMEAGSIKERAQRGQMTIRLAFLCVLFSFVTDIYGMNQAWAQYIVSTFLRARKAPHENDTGTCKIRLIFLRDPIF
jgi:hypothetical protein